MPSTPGASTALSAPDLQPGDLLGRDEALQLLRDVTGVQTLKMFALQRLPLTYRLVGNHCVYARRDVVDAARLLVEQAPLRRQVLTDDGRPRVTGRAAAPTRTAA